VWYHLCLRIYFVIPLSFFSLKCLWKNYSFLDWSVFLIFIKHFDLKAFFFCFLLFSKNKQYIAPFIKLLKLILDWILNSCRQIIKQNSFLWFILFFFWKSLSTHHFNRFLSYLINLFTVVFEVVFHWLFINQIESLSWIYNMCFDKIFNPFRSNSMNFYFKYVIDHYLVTRCALITYLIIFNMIPITAIYLVRIQLLIIFIFWSIWG